MAERIYNIISSNISGDTKMIGHSNFNIEGSLFSLSLRMYLHSILDSAAGPTKPRMFTVWSFMGRVGLADPGPL